MQGKSRHGKLESVYVSEGNALDVAVVIVIAIRLIMSHPHRETIPISAQLP